MNILITNDDGAAAAQLVPLIRWCRKLGNVTVVVPRTEQSAKSHSVEIRNPFAAVQVELAPDVTVWAVDSTPADCVRFAVSGLNMHFDLAISGINRGYNLGMDTMYSGTLAAATEAAVKGMKAIALSTSTRYYAHAVEHLDEIFRYLNDNRLLDLHSLYNINIPVSPKGIRITRLGSASFREEFIPVENGLYLPGGVPLRADGSDITRDTDAAALGYISVTPLSVDRTATDIFQQLHQTENNGGLL